MEGVVTGSPRITSLTLQQERRLGEIREEWLAIQGSTDPADRPAAEESIRAAYEAAGLAVPGFILWMSSPYASAIAARIAPGIVSSSRPRWWTDWRPRHTLPGGSFEDQTDFVARQVRFQLRGHARDRACAPAWQQDSEIYGMTVRCQLGDQVDARVRRLIDGQVTGPVKNVGDLIRSPVSAAISEQASIRLGEWRVGLQRNDAPDCSCAAAMSELGVDHLEPAAAGLQVARHAGWWWAFRDYAVATDRPELLKRDAQGRPHSESGPAIRYRDGWGFHAWHGTRVPAALIEDEPWDLPRIVRERNAEVRRCAIERTGWERLEPQLGAPVATAPDPGNPGRQLALYDVPTRLYESRVRLVLMTNGSPDRSGVERRYAETVPAEISNPVAAQAWAYGVPEAVYAATERRT
jgi:hypothetical protein